MGQPVAPTYVQSGYRWRDNVPDPATVDAAYDAGDLALTTPLTSWETDTLIRCRIIIKQTNASAENHNDLITEFTLQYDIGSSGSWSDLGAVGGGVESIDFASASGYADGAVTSKVIGSGTNVFGVGMETSGISGSVTYPELLARESELEFCMIINDSVVTDAEVFRIQAVFDSSGTPTAFTTYDDRPTVTVNKAAASGIPHLLEGSQLAGGLQALSGGL